MDKVANHTSRTAGAGCDNVYPGALIDRLGYRFKMPKWLDQALTHVSYKSGSFGGNSPNNRSYLNYERLEFLGDRVLGLVVADLLFERYPIACEGELARRFNYLVCKEMCAEVAEEMALLSFIRFGASELKIIDQLRLSVSADVCEAVIGAVYCDGGYQPARMVIKKFWAKRLNRECANERDPKTKAQEWLQSNGATPPEYEIVKQTGPDHAPLIKVAMRVEGFNTIYSAAGSRRKAEQQAAEIFLERCCDNGGTGS